ncbi:MAG: 4-(cytidine 5'-diphospho)-2-C-methyl-D-erythritol kinase [Lachnospiraceae bacterium]|jgi:4-diphosphocytidyl-2-C-methyl-D-erythritol kinase|nr:4-(cytidine 5'-diphospho)-2-C-methyl-D-erythritol kinase [Lachnospiraceae bacterium]
MDKMRLKALAKINLGLDVLRRREDGYHEVRMIMQTVHIYDQILMEKQDKAGIQVKTNLYYLPDNENNLVYKAAKLLMDEFHLPKGVMIDLKKYIPVAAGMAGGSSDAAAVLFGMNRMYNLGLSQEELMIRGVKIGADVPYCVMRGTALAEGIGEELTPLAPMPSCYILVAKPGISVSTKFVYENLRAAELPWHPDIDGMKEALERQDLKALTERMDYGNVLETVTVSEYPIIQMLKDTMKQYGALGTLMSGSGPTVFGVFDNQQTAKRAYLVLKRGRQAKQVFLTTPYNTHSERRGVADLNIGGANEVGY